MAIELTHARHDPMHCLAPGLFRSLKRGERKKLKLDVTYSYGQNHSARFIGFEPLGADDMRLLQGLVALSGPKGLILTSAPSAAIPKRLRLALASEFDSADCRCLVVQSRITQLLEEIGLCKSGRNLKTLKASLIRMSNVTVVIQGDSRCASFHLMSHLFDEDDNALYICLNPQIAEAVLGGRPHARIDMNEVRSLKSDPARLIHQRLCGWIDPGKSGRASLDTLCNYIWPDPAIADAMRKRQQIARRAVGELFTIGWLVTEYRKDMWEIRRPRNKSLE